MKPTIPTLTEEFTRLIGPEAFAKAEATIAAAKVAAEAAAKAAAEKAAAAAAAAKAAAEKAAADKAAGTQANVGGVPPPRVPPAVVPPSGGISAASQPTNPLPPKGGTTNANPAASVPATRPAAPAAAPRPLTPAPATVVPMPTLPVQATPHAAKGYDLDALVAVNQVVQAAQILDRAGFALDTITGVDWMAQGEMEVVYDYFHPTESIRVVVRTRAPRATPEVPTITTVFPGANWHERETHDFFGIRFVGHPNLKPFLLPEDADFHPLRKDYQP